MVEWPRDLDHFSTLPIALGATLNPSRRVDVLGARANAEQFRVWRHHHSSLA
jgi:hypothetical protein